MIVALLAWQIAVAQRTAVMYHDVPSLVVSLQVFEWREDRPPVPLDSGTPVAPESGRAQIDCVAGTHLVVSFARADGAYMLDGPFDCPADPAERRLDRIWRRTLHVRSPAQSQARAEVTWIPAGTEPPVNWPRCAWVSSTAECWGSALDANGVLVFADGDRVSWAVVTGGAAAPLFQQNRWGRLIVAAGGVERRALSATIAYPVVSPARRASIRLDTALVPNGHAMPVAADAIWVYGERIPASAWIELTAPRTAPTYLELDDVAHSSSAIPLWITLDEPRAVDVFVRGLQGIATGTVVTLFRLIDPPPSRGDPRQQPRRVFAAEKVADASGEIRFDALGDADYEIVAWHPQLGRGAAPVGRGDTSVTVRLASAGQVRGRVIAGGKVLAGVDVISLPDPQTYTEAADLTDLKGGDARTGADGRFVVSLAPGGGGEVRVGGGSYPIRRFPLPRAPIPVVDLGDIDLGAPIEVTIVLDRDPGCDIRAAGPVGRSGLQVIAGARAGPGLFRIAFPEEGTWEVLLLCGRDEHPLVPSVVSITQANGGKEVRMVIR